MGSVEDPDFAKQNDRDSAARPLADIPTKLLKQGLDVPPRQAAAYGTGVDQLKGALVLPLHPSIVLPLSTIRGPWLTALWIRITLAITWPPNARNTKRDHEGAAQVYGIVSRFAVSITDHLAEDRCAWQFEITSWGQSLRHHGMQRHSPDSQHVQESCESLTGA